MRIQLAGLNSEIVMGELNALKDCIQPHYTQAFIITDDKVAPLWLKEIEKALEKTGLKIHSHIIPAGETSKSLEVANSCWEQMHEHKLDRKSLVIGLGGGVITDLAGFVASTYMRGVDIIQIPTTLMGMVDAAIGGKTAVNLATGKNMVGTLHQPRFIFIHPQFLKSLPKREFKSGLAEVIKYGVIWDADLFRFLEKNMTEISALKQDALSRIIGSSCAIKAEIVSKDPTEQNLRAILNLGHTYAHALETCTHYKTYLHGEAVAIGMSCAASLSQHLGLCSKEVVQSINHLCKTAELDTRLPEDVSAEKIVELMAFDKKSLKGNLNLILVQEIGKVTKVNDVDPKIVTSVLKTKINFDRNA